MACWTSLSSTVCGTRPLAAGWANASATPNSASMTSSSQITRVPEKISTASSACSAKRAPSVTTSTRWRGRRSAQTPPSRRKPTRVTACTASTRPRSIALPVFWFRYSASATMIRLSPRKLNEFASHSRRNSRWRSTRAMSERLRTGAACTTRQTLRPVNTIRACRRSARPGARHPARRSTRRRCARHSCGRPPSTSSARRCARPAAPRN